MNDKEKFWWQKEFQYLLDRKILSGSELAYLFGQIRSIINIEQDRKRNRPKIICICGSTKFIDRHAIMKWELEKQGAIVLSMTLLPSNYPSVQVDHQAEFEGIKDKMDELHMRKIELADEVIIINVNGYIGESTRNEINYATKTGKPIKYLEAV